jgi:hypothetical protein
VFVSTKFCVFVSPPPPCPCPRSVGLTLRTVPIDGHSIVLYTFSVSLPVSLLAPLNDAGDTVRVMEATA